MWLVKAAAFVGFWVFVIAYPYIGVPLVVLGGALAVIGRAVRRQEELTAEVLAAKESAAHRPADEDRRSCPRCAESVIVDAQVCRFCQADLEGGNHCGTCRRYCDARLACDHVTPCRECGWFGVKTEGEDGFCSDCVRYGIPEDRAEADRRGAETGGS